MQVFHEVAYKARNRGDILAGIDEFLDKVTVLPPGEWDPEIRLAPPEKVPSQVDRRMSMAPKKEHACKKPERKSRQPPVSWSKRLAVVFRCMWCCRCVGTSLWVLDAFSFCCYCVCNSCALAPSKYIKIM